ncbi:MAG TPA: UDP-3-O-(3-hydroxymyristoyl)glucosamine N-acyltransferase [Bacteroidia bacterium]
MKKGIDAGQLALEFGLQVLGDTGHPILYPGSIKKHDANSLLWAKGTDQLDRISSGYVIINAELAPAFGAGRSVTYLVTDQKPRLIYARILGKYFDTEDDAFDNYVHEHRRNNKIRISDNVFIGRDVEIGDGTVIHPNVVIHSRTRIGKDCVIKTHVSLGTEGLGLELDKETNEFVKFPQIGGVVLEDGVEIGPCSTVRRSALDDTIIRKGTKIGSLVNIGHNCIVGQNCILTCMIVTSGSSVIGDNVFMGVNSVVKQGINIGSNVTIGQGAVVTRNVPDNVTYVGNPAEDIESYKLWSKVRKKLIGMFGRDVDHE